MKSEELISIRCPVIDCGNIVDGGTGDDRICSGSGDDTVHGGSDNDDIARL